MADQNLGFESHRTGLAVALAYFDGAGGGAERGNSISAICSLLSS